MSSKTFDEMSMSQEILDAIAEGELRLAMRQEEADRKAEEQLQAERTRIAEFWAPIVEQIRQSIPPWAHEYLVWPEDERPERSYGVNELYQPAMIVIPGVGTVLGYGCGNKSVRFHSMQYVLISDEDNRAFVTWKNYWLRWSELMDLDCDFHMALAEAAREEQRRLELQAEANRLNEQRRLNAREMAGREQVEPERDYLALAKVKAEVEVQDAMTCALIAIAESLRQRAVNEWGNE